MNDFRNTEQNKKDNDSLKRTVMESILREFILENIRTALMKDTLWHYEWRNLWYLNAALGGNQ